ncbi:hypothetical protein LZ31DRAFT_481415, partial [Colletotrichum somersetense]
ILQSPAVPSNIVPSPAVPSVGLPQPNVPSGAAPSAAAPSLNVPPPNLPSNAVPSAALPNAPTAPSSAATPSVTPPGATALFELVDLIGTTLSAINDNLNEIFQPNVDILDPPVLNRLSDLVNSLGTTGPLYSALSLTLAQARTLSTTLSLADSETLITSLNNDVVRSYSELLDGLNSRRSQLLQASAVGLATNVLGATTLIRGIFNNLNLGLQRQIDLNNYLVRIINPTYQPQAVQVTTSMQILLNISIEIFRP